MGKKLLSTVVSIMTAGVLLSSCQSDEKNGIAILGIDESGAEFVEYVEATQFRSDLSEALQTVQDSAIFALEQKPVRSNPWRLKAFIVGLGIQMHAGIKHIVSLGMGGRVRLVFSSSQLDYWP